MGTSVEVSRHYSRGDLLSRVDAAMREAGLDPQSPTVESLAGIDQFHGRGLEATRELADGLKVSRKQHLLDVGSGIGGPARYIADRFGCKVTGIDLTAEFCEVARILTQRLRLQDRVRFEEGDALAMPFANARFDGAYSMNVSMNIADKAAFHREIHRVLKPGGWLVLSEVARGPKAGLAYPTPWARTAETSFLASPSETRQSLEAIGFDIVNWRDTTTEAMAFQARARAMVERGEKPPLAAIRVVHGELAAEMAANVAQGLAQRQLIPIEVSCRKQESA